MADIFTRIRDAEACEPQPHLYWDTIFVSRRRDGSGHFWDWKLAGPDDPIESRGGLRSRAALHTATILQLFTDARAPDDLALLPGNEDRRGWWGDSIRLPGEPDRPLGSLLWTVVERGILDAEAERLAGEYAADALAVLAEQGAVANTEVTTERRQLQGMLGLQVVHYDRVGTEIYDQRFGVLWRDQVGNPVPMIFDEAGNAL